MEALILSLADKYDAILAPATTTGKNFLPRVAARLDVGQISEILKVVSPDTFERPIYAGNAIETAAGAVRQKSHHRAHHRLQGGGEGGSARGREDRGRAPIPACRLLRARRCRNPSAPNSPPPRS